MLPPLSDRPRPSLLTRLYLNAWDLIRHPGLHRDTFFLVAGTVIGALGGLIYWKIVTVRYMPAIVGLVAVAISLATFLGNLATLGLAAGLIRFLPGQDQNKKAALMFFAHRVVFVVAILTGLIFLAGRNWWAPGLLPDDYNQFYVIIFLLFVVAVGQMSIVGAILQAERLTPYLLVQYLVFNIIQILGGWLMPISLGAAGLLLSYMLPIGVVTIGFMILIPVLTRTASADSKRSDQLPRMDFVRYAFGLHLFNQMSALATLIFPLIVLYRLGAEANASLSITWYAYSFLSIIPSSAAAALFVDGSHTPEALGVHFVDALVFSLALISPLLLVTILLAPSLLGIFGPVYASAADLLRLLALSIIPSSVNSLYFIVRRVRKQIVSLNLLSLLLSVVSVILSYLLMGPLGLNGIGYGWLAGQTIFALAILPLIFRERRVARKDRVA